MPGKPKGEAPLPKDLPACADLLYATRDARLKLKKEVDNMEKLEKRLRERFINELPKSQSKGIAGKFGRVTIKKKPIPQVKDWDKFRAHILKTKDWDLLQKSICKEAINERLAAKKVVPGIEIFDAITVSCVKV
jgi:hypothetical protein